MSTNVITNTVINNTTANNTNNNNQKEKTTMLNKIYKNVENKYLLIIDAEHTFTLGHYTNAPERKYRFVAPAAVKPGDAFITDTGDTYVVDALSDRIAVLPWMLKAELKMLEKRAEKEENIPVTGNENNKEGCMNSFKLKLTAKTERGLAGCITINQFEGWETIANAIGVTMFPETIKVIGFYKLPEELLKKLCLAHSIGTKIEILAKTNTGWRDDQLRRRTSRWCVIPGAKEPKKLYKVELKEFDISEAPADLLGLVVGNKHFGDFVSEVKQTGRLPYKAYSAFKEYAQAVYNSTIREVRDYNARIDFAERDFFLKEIIRVCYGTHTFIKFDEVEFIKEDKAWELKTQGYGEGAFDAQTNDLIKGKLLEQAELLHLQQYAKYFGMELPKLYMHEVYIEKHDEETGDLIGSVHFQEYRHKPLSECEINALLYDYRRDRNIPRDYAIPALRLIEVEDHLATANAWKALQWFEGVLATGNKYFVTSAGWDICPHCGGFYNLKTGICDMCGEQVGEEELNIDDLAVSRQVNKTLAGQFYDQDVADMYEDEEGGDAFFEEVDAEQCGEDF